MCRVFSCVVGRGCLLWPVHSLGRTLLAFVLLHSEKAMSTHSSSLAWKVLWMEEPGRLQSMGSQEESGMTEQLHFHFSFSCIGEGNGNPHQCSYVGNPRDSGAWWAAISGVTQIGHDWSNLAAVAAASFCTLRPNMPVIPGVSWLPTFALQFP